MPNGKPNAKGALIEISRRSSGHNKTTQTSEGRRRINRITVWTIGTGCVGVSLFLRGHCRPRSFVPRLARRGCSTVYFKTWKATACFCSRASYNRHSRTPFSRRVADRSLQGLSKAPLQRLQLSLFSMQFAAIELDQLRILRYNSPDKSLPRPFFVLSRAAPPLLISLFLSFSLSIEIYRGFGETKGARDKRGERKLRPRRESFVRTSVSKSSAAAVRRAILSLRFLPPPSRPFVFVETTVVFQEERDTFQEQVCRIYNLGRKRIELPSSYQPSILCFFACIRRFVDRSPLPSERSLLASVLCKIIVWLLSLVSLEIDINRTLIENASSPVNTGISCLIDLGESRSRFNSLKVESLGNRTKTVSLLTFSEGWERPVGKVADTTTKGTFSLK